MAEDETACNVCFRPRREGLSLLGCDKAMSVDCLVYRIGSLIQEVHRLKTARALPSLRFSYTMRDAEWP